MVIFLLKLSMGFLWLPTNHDIQKLQTIHITQNMISLYIKIGSCTYVFSGNFQMSPAGNPFSKDGCDQINHFFCLFLGLQG